MGLASLVIGIFAILMSCFPWPIVGLQILIGFILAMRGMVVEKTNVKQERFSLAVVGIEMNRMAIFL